MTADNDLWRFSLRVYAAPGVADECLALQERYGIDVNVLLFCTWMAAERRSILSTDDIEYCQRAVTDWHARAVKPLRTARQAMKGLAGAEAVRTQVKALELESERLEQDMLFALAVERWPERGDAETADALRTNIDRYLQSHGAPGSQAVPHLMAAAATT
jgi:uncharacterized protein (TIGR02444 family)